MWTYKANLVRVIDGDTVVLKLFKDFPTDIDFGFYIKETILTSKSVELSFRLLGIDSPEVVGVNKAAGLLSKMELEKILKSGDLVATTYKPDKYGRWLVTIKVNLADGTVIDVAEHLVKNGFAVPYIV